MCGYFYRLYNVPHKLRDIYFWRPLAMIFREKMRINK